jgi:DNA-binding NarL/FixJ family response regulator
VSPDRPLLRVVIVDDHPIVRNGLRSLLESVDRFDVVGEAASGEQAVAAAAVCRPDIVIMDIEMPGMGGIEATRQVSSADPPSAVVMLTMYGEDELVFDALRAGARGYLLKGALQEDVVRTLEAVARGDAVFGSDVANRILRTLAHPRSTPAPFPQLTEREQEVLALLADGTPNGRIAQRLGLSSKTVANNVSNILTKLQAPDRAAAILQARRAGLGEP